MAFALITKRCTVGANGIRPDEISNTSLVERPVHNAGFQPRATQKNVPKNQNFLIFWNILVKSSGYREPAVTPPTNKKPPDTNLMCFVFFI